MVNRSWPALVLLAVPMLSAGMPTDQSIDEQDDRERRTTATVGTKENGRELLSTGAYITPMAAPGSHFQILTTNLRPDGNGDANGAYTSALSPDGKT